MTAQAQAQTPGTVTIRDVRGRSVTMPSPARRILIDDGRYLVALSLLTPDPAAPLVGWPRDINRIGDATWQAFRTRFPRLDSLPQTSSSAGTFSLERALAVRADVAFFTLGQGPSDAEVRRLESAGTAVVFIDFFSHPFEHLEPSLRLLGQALARQETAETFLAWRRAKLNGITAKISATTPRPRVFLEAHAGIADDCCNSPGKGNVGDYITLVGGKNIGEDVLPGTFGKLQLEYVLSQQPAVYIATGGPHLEQRRGLTLGQGYEATVAQQALARVSTRRGIASLTAVKAGRAHGLSHHLLNSPLDVLAIEAMARWIHPELFGTLDPRRTMAELNTRFLAVPLTGTYWTDLR